MTRRVVVILNAGSGSGNDDTVAARLRTLFEASRATADVRLVRNGTQLAAQIEAAKSEHPDVIVAGGGDGTVGTVAAALVDSDIALGVLALGTLNHFARALGVPLDVAEAVRCFAGGEPVRVDVGEVNGRVFVNNSSLGLYPDIVRDRERQQLRLGRGKLAAMGWAVLAVLRRYSFMRVTLRVAGRERQVQTPFVFIGNNEYQMEGLSIGERAHLDKGTLSLYFAQRPGRLRLLQFALSAVFGRLRQERDFETLLTPEVVIESGQRKLYVATDGEITMMAPPLRYRVRPASLRVIRAGERSKPPA